MRIYQALEASPSGKIAVKLSTGEPGSNYLRTDLIGELVQSLEGTAYGGSRANTAMHYQVAEEHGYTAIADVDIMDEDGSMTLPVAGGDNLTENYVGAHFADYCAQYDVTWPEVHMFPEEAVMAVEILGADIAMPIHWGAFSLAYHAWDDSVERFVAAGEEIGLQIVTPRIGETVKLKEPGDFMERWWRDIP